MEPMLVEVVKWLFARTDPILGLILVILCWLVYKLNQKADRIDARLTAHVNPDPASNKYPHPQCKEGETAYDHLCQELEKQHKENREDHREIFKLLRGEN